MITVLILARKDLGRSLESGFVEVENSFNLTLYQKISRIN